MRIEPTVGRMVWFYPLDNDQIPKNGKDPLSGQIAAVLEDGRFVNLCVLDAKGSPVSRTMVPLLQDGDTTPPNGYYAVWMPYQKGQAKKTEELEQKLAS